MADQELELNPSPSVDDLAQLIYSGFDNQIREGASAQEIDELQRRLGRNLPPSFRRFLELTDGATLYQTDEFFGVKNTPKSPGIAEVRDALNTEGLPDGLLPVGRKGLLYYVLDLTQPKPGGEYPVKLWNQASKIQQEFAPSFKDHLKRLVAVHQPID